jgi:hypothetical protein
MRESQIVHGECKSRAGAFRPIRLQTTLIDNLVFGPPLKLFHVLNHFGVDPCDSRKDFQMR